MEPIQSEPVEKTSPEYVNIMKQIRQSMAEIDKDVSSLEESYDAILEHQKQPPLPPSQNSTQQIFP